MDRAKYNLGLELLRARFRRLFVPYWGWSLVTFAVFGLLAFRFPAFAYPLLGFKANCFRGTFLVFAVCWLFCFALERFLPKPLKGLVQ